jgi:aminocarboxymuconate-semialdehyde decarboxylase
MIIDVHAHYTPQTLLDDLKSQRRLFPSLKVTPEKDSLSFKFAHGDATRPIMARLSDVAARRAWLDKSGVQKQVVGGWLDMFGYELPADEGADWSRFMNEHMLKAVKSVEAFTPLCTVPMQNGRLAAEIFDEAMRAGFHGAMIGTQPKGLGGNLDDPDLDPFWEAAQAHRATLFIHPMYACGDERLFSYDLVNAIGRISDSSAAVGRLMKSGHLQKYPDVNLVLSHGGGALPYILGRLKKSHAAHPAYADPQASFERLYFDTVLFEIPALKFLCEVAGPKKVVLGTDHPFPLGDADPVKTVGQIGLGDDDKKAVLGGTAAKLFRIDCGCGRPHGFAATAV